MAEFAVVAARNRSRRSSPGMPQEDGISHDTMKMKLDGDGNNRVSHVEMREHLDDICIRADVFVGRLNLENDMCQMMVKLPLFIIVFLCFLAALIELAPAASVNDVHRHLKHHFGLDSTLLGEVKDVDTIYTYMENFEQKNEELQATSAKYWCEHRYTFRHWDEKLAVPVTTCKSARQHALSLTTDKDSAWTAVTNNLVSHQRGVAVPACDDDDEKLQEKTGDMNITCSLAAVDNHHKVCEEDLGILVCPKTCGFCSPFTYDHKKDFTKPQVTLLPISVFQTRFAVSDCHGFAHTYELQPHNPVLTLLPALDGTRKGRVLTCVDRNKHAETQYSHEVSCPPAAPPSLCPDGKLRHSPKRTYHGTTVYAKMLIEPHRDVEAMKSIQWIDLQTDTTTLSTLVYTAEAELFTLLEVEFQVDGAGNIDGKYTMISYRDLIGQAKLTFIVCLSVCVTVSFIHLVIMAYQFFRCGVECNWGYLCYEFCSRTIMLFCSAILLITWHKQMRMADEYDHLLHTFLDIEGISDSHIDGAMDSYFAVLSHVYDETKWLNRHRTAGYFVVYSQFLQFIFYMNAHPKMASLTATVMRSLNNFMHVTVLFVFIFAMLAWMAHWMFGEHIKEFGSFEDTISAQKQMFYGEFIKAEEADELHGSLLVMYWVYAWTFMLVIWLLLLNFLLAILFYAFVEVKDEFKDLVFVADIATDIVRVCHTRITALRYRWPSNRKLTEFFEQVIKDTSDKKNINSRRRSRTSVFMPRLPAELHMFHNSGNVEKNTQGPTCPPAMMKTFQVFQTQDAVTRFLLHYYKLCPYLIALGAEVSNSLERDSNAPGADVPSKRDVETQTPEDGDWDEVVISTL